MTDKKIQLQGFGSEAVHGGNIPDPNFAHLTPIYASSTFYFDTAEQGMERFAGADKTKIYSRWGNPGFTVAEQKIAALEAHGLKDKSGNPLQLKALLHASGQAAMTTMFMSNLKAGDAILTHYSLYGGTQELLTKVLANSGISTIIADLRDPQVAEDAIRSNPAIRLVHVETPANPTLQCVDLEMISTIAKKHGLIMTVDNTFATPYLQQPFKFDVDFVFHSTTKFLNGHGTAIGGVLLGRDLEFMNTRAWKWYALLGGNANPFDAFMLTQGIRTLEIRMDRHCSNAMLVAQFLEQHPAIGKVNYTGLESHPDHKTAMKQMRHPGGMLSYELKGGLEAGIQFINRLQVCVRAISLGTVDTLVSHPASMSHAGIPREEREKYGINDGLIRMSVGIENIEDILGDLAQALEGL
ncbi:aminotransferase class I/II-fold pyridoxal phosphate-dependent enzyme [Flavihumibacter rivuli]|uniref:trans-sulfuration enzyme family protein n=1 Tax=Flavihumibacter rivuli TaxID=2838156 RepID=UPI001BDEF05A|nr:aminotransferase class I/II-fold pyridoxal phosphate-dependent enzyme [Flavihumibacter rivuli]ULQ56760.1 aminotransferase class I/II-fold pyridoxal phosphate-dependent enzyme [Flavihumibacter rivuli]